MLEMGNCAFPQHTKKGPFNLTLDWQSTTVKIVIDGRLQEFRQSIKASHLLFQNPNYFLCSSESMYVNRHLPHVAADEELQLGQIYFLLPLSKSHALLSLQELCSLAVMASSALARQSGRNACPSAKTLPYLHRNGVQLLLPGGRKTPVGFQAIGGNFPAGQSIWQIEF